MEKISLKDFEEICLKNPPSVIIFASGNQHSNKLLPPIQYEFVFDSIAISLSKKNITIGKKQNFVSFKQIRYIKKHGNSALGTIYTVVCNNIFKGKDSLYTVILR